jgi:hypothetical protein
MHISEISNGISEISNGSNSERNKPVRQATMGEGLASKVIIMNALVTIWREDRAAFDYL